MTIPLDTAPFFTGEQLSFSATGLPAGLTIDPASGQITGTPTSEGSSAVSVSATNPAGTAAQNFTWNILAAAGGGDPVTAETGAAGHWVFGADYPAMADLVSGQTLSEQIAGASSLDPASVTISDGDGSTAQAVRGLVSTRPQTVEQTICVVFSSADIGNRIVAGNLSTGDGAGLFLFNGDLHANARGFPFGNTAFDPGMPQTSPFVFAAMSVSAIQNWVLFRGAPSGSVTVSGAPQAAPAPTAAPLGIGNTTYSSNAFSAGGSYAEFIVFESHKTEAEIEAIYQRSKARMSGRGITVL